MKSFVYAFFFAFGTLITALELIPANAFAPTFFILLLFIVIDLSFDAPLKSHLLQVILADSITLTPGTITVRLYEEKFEVHCLDESMAEGLNDSVFVKMLKKWEES